ncbi:hypothetical protein DV738_g2681, partial [Chaetothyriales sp. CBS 135597]
MPELDELNNKPSSVKRYVPKGKLAQAAFKLALETLTTPLLHHSLRTFLFAKWLANTEGSTYGDQDLDSLFVACVFHDFGATENHDHSERFEVCGADAAIGDIWAAIALHTSPGIAERIHPLARLVRLGVLLDFRKATRDELNAHDYGTQIEADVPRLEIEKVLGDAVVQQAVSKKDAAARSKKAPASSWAGLLLRSHLEDPTWAGVNRAF